MDPIDGIFYAIIDKNKHQIIATYYSSTGPDQTKPGASFDPSVLIHKQVPVDFCGKPFIKVSLSTNGEDYQFELDQSAIDQSIKEQWVYLREQRDLQLKNTDWRVMVSDRPLSDEERAKWIAYRQALRDLPMNTQDPANIVWPTPPS